MVIEGPHNSANPRYLEAVLLEAKKLLASSQNKFPAPLTLANEIVENLGLPKKERTIVAAAIAKKFAPIVSSAYIDELLSRLKSKKPIPSQSSSPALSNSGTESLPKESLGIKVAALKASILKILEEKKIVPESYLQKVLANDLKEKGITLRIVENNCTLKEIMWGRDVNVIVSNPDILPTTENLVQMILEENQHKPFNIWYLAERFGFDIKEMESLVRRNSIGSLIMWTSYDVWSIKDIMISEQTKEKISRLVGNRNGAPILLDDAFNWVFSGLLSRNMYDDINVGTKELAIRKAFNSAGIFDYKFDKKGMRFIKTCYVPPQIKNEQEEDLDDIEIPRWED